MPNDVKEETKVETKTETKVEAKPEGDKVTKEGEVKPETKVEGETKVETKVEEKPKAPEKYEFKILEGSAIDKADMARVEKLAREADYTNDEAQAMLDATNAVLVEQSEQWISELKADGTYGGEKLAETQKLANQILDKVRPKGTPRGDGLRAMLNRGVGNNIEVASFLADLGRMMQEDPGVLGDITSGEGNQPKSLEERMYPNSPEFKK